MPVYTTDRDIYISTPTLATDDYDFPDFFEDSMFLRYSVVRGDEIIAEETSHFEHLHLRGESEVHLQRDPSRGGRF